MKKIVLAAVIIFFSYSAIAQATSKQDMAIQQKNDSVALLIKDYINIKSADKLYDLASEELRGKVGTKDRWNKIFETTYFKLGQYKKNTFQSIAKGVSKYKAEFETITLFLSVGLDKNGKLTTLEFVPQKGESVIRK